MGIHKCIYKCLPQITSCMSDRLSVAVLVFHLSVCLQACMSTPALILAKYSKFHYAEARERSFSLPT